jgi:peptidoglycan/LPS O-acetylase OafA/YrhL
MEHRTRIGALDAWRFVAVWLVIFSHLIAFSNVRAVFQGLPGIPRLERLGTLGVLIFFVISGFVICRGLIISGTPGFYVRRAFRILPPLWLYLLGIAVLASSGALATRGDQIAFAGLFLCNVGVNCGWFLGHTWSLAYEEQFYLIFPFLFVIAPRRSVGWMVGGCIALSLLLRATGRDLPADFLMFFGFLFTGCGAAVHEQEVRRLCARVTAPMWLTFFFGLLLGDIFAPPTWLLYMQTLLFPGALLTLMLATPKWKFFSSRRIQHLGRISYTVYLWQQLATATWTGMPWWGTLIAVAAVWAWALVSWRWVELPLIEFARTRTTVVPGMA